MKCPRCGFFTPAPKTQCSKCGYHLPVSKQAEETKDQDHSPVPEWRREVSEKARAYGEKRKLLTTPPQPLKENEEDADESAAPNSVEIQQNPGLVPPREPEEPRMILQTPEPDSSVDLAPKVLARDWIDSNISAKDDTSQAGKAHLIWRRAASFIVDNTILIVLSTLLVYCCGWIIHSDFQTLIQTAWLPLLGGFLLFHFLYYAYFYKTSRQTPGQVFFSLELRDPASSDIPLWKIIARWMAMVFLNVFNFIPMMMKDGQLLLDQVSRTEIRSLK
jgi:uncharacterized RDD family membrane protein YckC